MEEGPAPAPIVGASLSYPHGRRGIVSGFGLTRTNVWDKPKQIGKTGGEDESKSARQGDSVDDASDSDSDSDYIVDKMNIIFSAAGRPSLRRQDHGRARPKSAQRSRHTSMRESMSGYDGV